MSLAFAVVAAVFALVAVEFRPLCQMQNYPAVLFHPSSHPIGYLKLAQQQIAYTRQYPRHFEVA